MKPTEQQCTRCGRMNTMHLLADDTYRCTECKHRMSGAQAATAWSQNNQELAREWLLSASAKETTDFIEELTFKSFAAQAFNITHQLIKGARA